MTVTGLLSILLALAIGAASLWMVARLLWPKTSRPSRKPLTPGFWLWEQEYGRWAQQQRAKEDL